MMASIVNPHRGLGTEGGWTMGFSRGFVGPAFSREPPLVIAPEQVAAFNEGVLAGQQAAIEGLSIEPPCVSLEQEVSSGAEGFMEGVHVLELIGLIRAAKHFAHFTVGRAGVGVPADDSRAAPVECDGGVRGNWVRGS
jgi:hypothetical protein